MVVLPDEDTEDDDDLPTVVPNSAADFIVPTDYVIPAGVGT